MRRYRNRVHVKKLPADVYRVYGKEGELLYVGMSAEPVKRIHEHKSESAWFPLAHEMRIDVYPTRDEAQRAEAVAIETEKPRYNIRPERWALSNDPPPAPADVWWADADSWRTNAQR